MKIGILIGSNQIGGMERQAAILSQGLKREGHYPIVFLGNKKHWGPTIDFNKVRTVSTFDRKFIRWGSRLYFSFLLNNFKADCLLAYNIGSLEKAIKYTNPRNVPIIVSIRGTKFAVNEALKKRYKKACIKTNHITCNCPNTKNLLIDNEICLAEKISVIHNGITPMLQKTGKRVQNKFNILFAGSFKDVKDPLTFCDSVNTIMHKHKQIRVTFAGDGPLLDKMKDLFASSGHLNRVSFLGNVSPANVPFNCADLVVSSSIREASSNTILEALANGVPVVGTAVGGTVNILKNKPFGILIAPKNRDEMHSAIEHFIRISHAEKSAIEKQARIYIQKKYSSEAMIKKHIKLFTSCIDNA